MARLVCARILRQAPASGCLLLYLEHEVLKRHCCEHRSLKNVAAALSLTPAEARRIHDRASLRLGWAVFRLMSDLRGDGQRRRPTAQAEVIQLRPKAKDFGAAAEARRESLAA